MFRLELLRFHLPHSFLVSQAARTALTDRTAPLSPILLFEIPLFVLALVANLAGKNLAASGPFRPLYLLFLALTGAPLRSWFVYNVPTVAAWIIVPNKSRLHTAHHCSVCLRFPFRLATVAVSPAARGRHVFSKSFSSLHINLIARRLNAAVCTSLVRESVSILALVAIVAGLNLTGLVHLIALNFFNILGLARQALPLRMLLQLGRVTNHGTLLPTHVRS